VRLVVWVVIAALGLTTLLRTSEIGYEVLRIAGAILPGLARRTGVAVSWAGTPRRTHPVRLLGSGSSRAADQPAQPQGRVFFVAFLPAFIPRGASGRYDTAVRRQSSCCSPGPTGWCC